MFKSRLNITRNQLSTFVRQNSSAAPKTKTSKLTKLIESTVYWGKVTGEVGKQVYLKEGFAPPSISEFKSTYECVRTLIKNPNLSTIAFNGIKNVDKKTAILYGSYVVQVLGFFSLGEIIGRRKISGY